MSLIKITGFMFLTLSGFLLGLNARHKIYRHAQTLVRLTDILSRLESEIAYAHTSPEEFFEIAAQESDYIGSFFKCLLEKMRKQRLPLSVAWSEAIALNYDALCLAADEKAELERLGKALGRLDLDGAKKAVGLACESLKSNAADAKETKKNEGRLKLTLYTTGGILIALLLI